MSQDWRSTLYLPGLLEKAISVRAKEFGYPSLSPFFTELVCFDLRKRAPHDISLTIFRESPEARDWMDREIVRYYVPKGPRSFSLLRRLTRELAESGHFGNLRTLPDFTETSAAAPPINPETWPGDGPASKFSYKARLPKALRAIIEIRWAELEYPNLSEYVTGLVRYDLMLGGPHTYFNGCDTAPDLLAALDAETELTFHARQKRQRILLDYLIEEAAGRELSDAERDSAKAALVERLRELAKIRSSRRRQPILSR